MWGFWRKKKKSVYKPYVFGCGCNWFFFSKTNLYQAEQVKVEIWKVILCVASKLQLCMQIQPRLRATKTNRSITFGASDSTIAPLTRSCPSKIRRFVNPYSSPVALYTFYSDELWGLGFSCSSSYRVFYFGCSVELLLYIFSKTVFPIETRNNNFLKSCGKYFK